MTNVLFTTDEVLLNRMEAYTMLGEYDRAILDLKAYTLSSSATSQLSRMIATRRALPSDYALYAPFYGLTVRQLPDDTYHPASTSDGVLRGGATLV